MTEQANHTDENPPSANEGGQILRRQILLVGDCRVGIQPIDQWHAGCEFAFDDLFRGEFFQNHHQRPQRIAVGGDEHVIAFKHAGQNLLEDVASVVPPTREPAPPEPALVLIYSPYESHRQSDEILSIAIRALRKQFRFVNFAGSTCALP